MNGLDCFFDKESIAWDANRVVGLEDGLDECEVVVLVLPPEGQQQMCSPFAFEKARWNRAVGFVMNLMVIPFVRKFD